MLPSHAKKLRIGDLLVDNQIITPETLEVALAEQKKTGGRLGNILIQLGLVEEDTLLQTLADQLNYPLVSLSGKQYDKKEVCSLSEIIARRFRVVVLHKTTSKIVLAMADPTDIFCLDEVSKHFSVRIEPVVAKESEIVDLINISYSGQMKIASLVKEVNEGIQGDVLSIDEIVSSASDDEAPVAKLLLKIFEEAIRYNASDIHIEPDETVLRIRQRIDGVLSEQVLNEKRVVNTLVIKLKLMAALDIAEKRLPQDGRFTLTVHGKKIDVRLSTMPVSHGESVVMRLLLIDEAIINLDNLGIPEPVLASFRKVIQKPHGLILVTGPTGSGKTTSLYAALSELNDPHNKIITVEDPIEYRLPRVSQVQVNDKIGLSFSTVLRSALRQDPNVLLIGEIRDQDSAEIALRSSMTGHLVFSTLHTNDAPSAALRLIDIGAKPYLVASSVTAIVAQRLVRCLCEHCKKAIKINYSDYSDWLPEAYKNKQFYTTSGCHQCSHTGYKGRTGVYELLIIDETMKAALREANVAEFMKITQQSADYQPLLLSAINTAIEGLTSLDEIEKLVN